MKKYFNVLLEFDKKKVDRIIEEAINKGNKGYVCSVERNILAEANLDHEYNNIVNKALVNICDGNFVAKTISWVYDGDYESYIGADLFINYIRKCKYNQYFLGNTQCVLDGLRDELSKLDPGVPKMPFVPLPFRKVQNFDYEEIAEKINFFSPDIVWVSLGAPKQEEFMYRLKPYINKGVMFGFGAIFNFYSGLPGQRRAPKIFLDLKIEWVYRLLQDPKKNFLRNWKYLKMVPKLILDEKRNKKMKI